MCDNKNKKSYKNLIDKFIFKKIRDIMFFLEIFFSYNAGYYMEIIDFFMKKQSKYLLTLLMFNNLNAGGCKKKCGNNGNDKNKQSSTQSSEQSGGQEKPKGENPDLEEETEEEKKERLEEEEKKKKEQVEIDRLNEKAAPIKKFFTILKKAYECKLTSEGKQVIKCDIDDVKLRDFVKYLEDLDFTEYTDNDFSLLGKLLQLFKINGVNEDFDNLVNQLNNSKGISNEVIKKSAHLTYVQNLFNYTSDCNLLIVKDKYTRNFYFTIKQQANLINYKNEKYDIIDLYIHEGGYTRLLKQSNDDNDEINEIHMNLALNLSSNLLRDFYMCLTYDAATILKHVEDSNYVLPNVDAKLPFYSEIKENDIQGTYSYVWTNGYLHDFLKDNVDANKLYKCQNILKIKVDENYKIQYSFEKGKKDKEGVFTDSIFGAFTNTPFGIETTGELGKILTELNDPSKIEDVKNKAIELLKKDKEFKGSKISIMQYLPSISMNFFDFNTKDIKNSDFPYIYNIYIYKDNRNIKIDIRKWKDNEKNKNIIKNINDFGNAFKKELGDINYNFSKVVSLFRIIMLDGKSGNLNSIINIMFSELLQKDEWDKLNTDNLCLKIADDLSSIELGRDIAIGAGFKVFFFIKNTTDKFTYFKSIEKKK